MGGVVGGGGGHFVELKSTYLDTATMRVEESQEIEGDDTGDCGLSVCFFVCEGHAPQHFKHILLRLLLLLR